MANFKRIKKLRKKKMSDELTPIAPVAPVAPVEDPGQMPEVVKDRVDLKNKITLTITRPGDGQYLELYIKAPVVAEIIRKMDKGNYPIADYAEVYREVLLKHPEAKDRIVSRPAIGRITKNFAPGTDFDFNLPPRSCLLHNPDKLSEGYTLKIKIDTPYPLDVLRRWGKQFMEGCNDIISNARPFKMTWVMNERETQ